MGRVVDIVFAPGKNPNCGDLPQYILVDFFQYIGPAFIPDHPTWIPIPCVTIKCKNKCCEKSYCPLDLCYAKTVHTFQGQSVGMTSKDQPDNAIQRIVCDPGTKTFEGQCPGLFYTTVSRPTTLGKGKMDSAIYFLSKENNMNPKRVMSITRGADGKLFRRVYLRDLWVRLLKKGVHDSGLSAAQKDDLFSWAANGSISKSKYDQVTLN